MVSFERRDFLLRLKSDSLCFQAMIKIILINSVLHYEILKSCELYLISERSCAYCSNIEYLMKSQPHYHITEHLSNSYSEFLSFHLQFPLDIAYVINLTYLYIWLSVYYMAKSVSYAVSPCTVCDVTIEHVMTLCKYKKKLTGSWAL